MGEQLTNTPAIPQMDLLQLFKAGEVLQVFHFDLLQSVHYQLFHRLTMNKVWSQRIGATQESYSLQSRCVQRQPVDSFQVLKLQTDEHRQAQIQFFIKRMETQKKEFFHLTEQVEGLSEH